VPIGVDPGGAAVLAHPPALPARADEAEADAAQPVAVQLGGVSPKPDRDEAAAMEHLRQSRLRLWQSQGSEAMRRRHER
jgi:hypothetical protein